MAGSLLARQLSRQIPGRKIAVFERKTEYGLNLGESMVEIASNYFIRRLGLGSYLYDRQYPKNGLRFFFDSPDRNTPLEQMSEIGSRALPQIPGFQIDRRRLEADISSMNVRDGVQVERGCTVEQLVLGEGGRSHRLVVSGGAKSRIFESRWVVDATGRRQLIAKLEGLRVSEDQLRNASIWGWFEGVADVDTLGPESFRKRVAYSPRRLSTIHFVYRGYWIWFIPLQEGLTSIGLVCEKPYYDRKYCSDAGFLAFLRQHAAVASLLENARPLATRSFAHIAYQTRRFISPDRWALIGEAAAFPDPFYSPGADFIALENDLVADLVERDLGGAPEREISQRASVCDDFLQFRFSAAMQLYRNQYPFLGSYELCKLKWDFDIACYYNLWVWPYMLDDHLNLRALKRQVLQRRHVLSALHNFGALFGEVDAHLTKHGTYYRRNSGEYSDGQDLLGFVRDVGSPTTHRESLRRTEEIFNIVRFRALDLLEDAPSPRRREPKRLAWFMGLKDLRGD